MAPCRRVASAIAAAVILIFIPSVTSADTVLNMPLLSVGVEGTNVSETVDLNLPHFDLPYSGEHMAHNARGFSSNARYALSPSQFRIDFDQYLPSSFVGLARASGFIIFVVTADTTYDLAGESAFWSLGQSAVGARFHGMLEDITGGSHLANYAIETIAASGEFALDQVTGTGSLQGALTKDHTYVFTYFAITKALTAADSGATASGSITLSFGDPTAVPLPSPLLAGLVLMAVAAATRVRRPTSAAAD